jgi:Uma2 family endonuclease
MAPDMTTSPRVPVLHAGDRLTRDEFERRYEAMPHVKKAELLEGMVYMPSPARWTHGEAHALLAGWSGFYATRTPGLSTLIGTSFRVDLDNEVQPDLMLRVDGPSGRSRIDADHFVIGAPELVFEVAVSSVSYDLHQKLHVYRRAGVQEYLVLRVEDGAVDWFELRRGAYERLPTSASGHLRSEVFPGLWLDVAALLRGDAPAMHALLQLGLASPDHATFVARLGMTGK